MKAVFVIVLLAVSVSAMTRLHKIRRASAMAADKSEWDIAEGISGAAVAMGKVEGHEQSVKDAYNGLSTTDKAAITNPTKSRSFFEAMHTPTDMIMGVQYPDMPIGGPVVSALGDDLATPTHVNVATFGTFFKAGSTGARNTFVAQTHYGCLQFWHAMAPEPYVGGKYKVWSNSALSSLIKNGATRIWNVAVGKLAAGKKNMAEFHLGRVLHTIGDSYAKGHTFRGGSDNCGPIIVFQEYNAQKGNEAHGQGDKPATNQDTFGCTVTRVRQVLQYWAGCVRANGRGSACAYPSSIINPTFDVDPAVATLDAGGSIEFFAGPDAKSKGTSRTVTAGGKTVKVYFPAQNGLTRVAGTSDVASVCPPF